MNYELRPYQDRAMRETLDFFKHRHKSALVVLPTGCGKTSVMSAIAEVVSKNGGKVLFLAHRTTLVTQGAKAIGKATGIKVGKDRGKNEIPSESIIVSTVQAMSKDSRLEKYGPEFFNLIMIDESHHIPASSYQKVISYFTKARILGVTATPKRGDHTDVTDIFESVSSEYTMYEAINDGWLSPIKTQTCPVQIDVSKCEIQSGDYSVSDIGEALKPYMENIVDQIIEKSGNRKTIIFVPLVATAKSVVEMFRARGVDADYVAGERKDSDDVLKAYHNGEFRILINSLLLTEGYDEPSISCVVNLRLTKSEALYCLDEETEILTPNGFKNNIEVGDLVGAFDTKTNEIKFVPALETIRRPLNKDEYFCSIQTNRTDIRVTNKHRMVYDNKRGLGWKFKTAEELCNLKDCNRIPVSGETKFKGVPLTNDEIRFISWVMTDGCINKKTNAIQISQASHQPWIDEIEKVLQNCELKYGKHIGNSKTNFNRNSNNIVFTISKGKPRGTQKDKRGWGYLEAYISKDISNLLFEMSEKQFEIMLETIHFADGGKVRNQNWEQHSYHIAKGNKTFIENLQMMAIMRGYLANVSVYTKNRKNPLYVLHIKKQRYVSVGSTYDNRPSWLKEEHTDEICWCVQNELGTLVTRRNGKVAIVGNCQIIGRGTRLSPETGKEDLLVLDFLWKDKEKRKHLNAKNVVAAGDASISDEDLDDIQRACECSDEEPTDVFEGIEKAKKDVRRQREEALARAIEETNRKQEEEEKKRKQREDQIRALGEAREEIVKGGKVVNVGDHLSIVYDEFGSMVLCAITNDEAVRQMGLSDYYPEGYSWEFAPPTDNQMKALMRLGFPVGYVASKGHCSFLMNALFDREKRGLCSYKQIKLLSRYKLGDLSMCSREKAKRGMDILSKNGWRPTSELYAVFNGKEFTASDTTDTSNIEIC